MGILNAMLLGGSAYATTRIVKKPRKIRLIEVLVPQTGDNQQRQAEPASPESMVVLTNLQRKYVEPLLDSIYERCETLVHQYTKPSQHSRTTIDDRRHELAAIIGSNGQYEISEEEKKYNRLLTLASGALLSNVAGFFFLPPLKLLSILPLLYLSVDSVRNTYTDWIHERKIGANANHTVFCFGMMAVGSFGLLAFIWTVIAYAGKAMLKTRDLSRRNLVNILGETPRSVWIEKDGIEVEIPFESIQAEDCIVVHAGSMIPVDGHIVKGLATIDQHMLTGEAQPAEKSEGLPVYAGTIVLSGTITVQVEKAGEDTVAVQIGEILNRTADYRSSTELRGTMIADRSVPPALALSALTWALLGPVQAIAVISCSIGYHMTFTAPLSVLNFLQISAKKGLLIKDGRALEMVSNIDTVVFDKTGTLTDEKIKIYCIHSCADYTKVDILRYAAAAEYKQTHPIARAILEESTRQQLEVPTIDDAAYEIGYGIQVTMGGQQVLVGSILFMQRNGLAIPHSLHATGERCKQDGHSLVYVAIDNQLAGAIELHATIRPEVQDVIQKLKARNLQLYIISGDHESPTRQLADTLGIEHYFAEVLPEDKARLIRQLQSEGKSVCFVGDGINDAIALKTADVSVSLRGATTIAMDTAQVILRDANLRSLPQLFEISDKLTANMQVNLLASTIPGIISIAGVYFLHFGILTANILAWTGLGVGLTNAMSPTFKENLHVSHNST